MVSWNLGGVEVVVEVSRCFFCCPQSNGSAVSSRSFENR